MGKFNLADYLSADVSNSDTNREQIEYIDIDLIEDDPNNFYELSGIDELAANIELVGLQQPLRVRTDPNDNKRVILLSGHRRKAALKRLVDEGQERFRSVPCIRERLQGSAAMQELRLIYANADTRKMSSADLARQAERVEMLLYQLKEEGIEFPGRMRDHVASACQVSKSKLARLKVIRDNLDFSISPFYEKGQVSESVAYKFAQQPKDVQLYIAKSADVTRMAEWAVGERVDFLSSLEKRTCKKSGTGACTNKDKIYEKVFDGSYRYKPCRYNKCCSDCSELASCKSACPHLADKIKKLKADKKEAKRQEKLAQEERDRPSIAKIEDLWMRFGYAREHAHKSVKDTFEAIGRYYTAANEAAHIDNEYCRGTFTPCSNLPYGYARLSEVESIIKAADFFGCSLDYLLGRTDELTASAETEPVWRSGVPEASGLYAAKFDCDGYVMKKLAFWDNCLKKFYFDDTRGASIEADCIGWYPVPQD